MPTSPYSYPGTIKEGFKENKDWRETFKEKSLIFVLKNIAYLSEFEFYSINLES